MLFEEKLLLTFNFRSQFFFTWKVQGVLRSEKLFIAMQDGELGYIRIRIRTENNPQRRIVAVRALH